MEEVIKTSNLGYKIGEKKILDNVSVIIPKHKMIGVIGPNGSGKTTLLKHIYRVLPVDKNKVFLYGKDLNEYRFQDSAREMSVMRQENATEFEYSIMEMVLLGRAPYRKAYEGFSAEDKEIARKALACTGMLKHADRSFVTLSGGEKQRVLLARSLAQQTDILILDEPTNHLDVHYQWALMDLVKELDKTVVAVFHELNLACTYCDYLYILKDGVIVECGESQHISTSEILKKVFEINADVVERNNGRKYIVINNAIA